MGEPGTLDRAFHIVMKRMVKTGQAPYYTELAADLGISPEEGRKVLHKLFSAGVPGGYTPIRTILSPLPLLTTSRHNIDSLLKGSRNGSPNEGSKRWRSVGCFPEKL